MFVVVTTVASAWLIPGFLVMIQLRLHESQADKRCRELGEDCFASWGLLSFMVGSILNIVGWPLALKRIGEISDEVQIIENRQSKSALKRAA